MLAVKLDRAEWRATEKPVAPSELTILHFLRKAATQTTLKENNLPTLYSFLKIPPSDAMSLHLFHTYFTLPFFKAPGLGTVKLKKADVIRLGTKKNVKDVYESLVADACLRLWKKMSDVDYYSLHHLRHLCVSSPNPYVLQAADVTLKEFTPNLLNLALKLPLPRPHPDLQLYEHQRRLFETIRAPSAKLIMYMAPTGTGKTLSPLGIPKFVMVCAARHVALDLAKICVATSKPVALAFGCESMEDVRLHHNAATVFTRDKRTGGIGKVDNMQGEKVEAMICDMASYEIAMRYMLTFNKPGELVLYWDEPTISMDKADDPLHALVRAMWRVNEIPNVVLSSATLPRPEEIEPVLAEFKAKFNAVVHVIESYDCEKTVRVLDEENTIVMPHNCGFEEMKVRATFLEKNKTLLRYVDFDTALETLSRVDMLSFQTMEDVTVSNVKMQYAAALTKMDSEKWEKCQFRKKAYEIDLTKLVTSAAWTVDGPAVYLCSDVYKLGESLLGEASIPPTLLKELMKHLDSNTAILEQIGRLDKDMQDANSKDCEKEKKMADGRLNPLARKIQAEMERLGAQIKVLGLPQSYVPNTAAHAAKYRSGGYAAILDEEVVGKILGTEVEDLWKILLLMGIGLLSTKASPAYAQLIKELASSQRLYVIVADADHVYGTNYPFTHAYLGEDLDPSKTLQAMGRVGRGDQMNCTVRMRNGSNLFQEGKEASMFTLVLSGSS